MSASVDGKISIGIRDIAVFNDQKALQDFIKDTVEPRLIAAVADMYTTTTRGGGTFNIQPLHTRVVSDLSGGTGGFRGVEIGIEVHGRFG